MKKWIPVVLFLVGTLVFAGLYFFVIRGNNEVTLEEEDATVAEIPLDQRPFTSLTPSDDGHFLKLEIKGIKVDAETMDYELLYKVEDGRTQGVPGTIPLAGQNSIERDLLLGSESSGKFRFDEGVETGTLTLRFRNKKGKLVGKLSTDWHLQTADTSLETVDKQFTYSLNKLAKGVFFVTMETFGLPIEAPGSVSVGPFGVFTSADGLFPGSVDGVTHLFTLNVWKMLEGGVSSDIGVFVLASE